MTEENQEKHTINHNLTDHHEHVAVIDILGQRAHIPLNQSLVLVIVILVTGIVAIEFISHGVSNSIKYVATGSYSQITTEETNKNSQQSARIYQFWTPGENTWNDMVDNCQEDSKCLTKIQEWKKSNLVSKSQLTKFGQTLISVLKVPGYSRFPVYGSGGDSEKSGWYWRVIVSEGNKLDKKLLIEQYKKFFSRDNLRIEESYIGKPEKA